MRKITFEDKSLSEYKVLSMKNTTYTSVWLIAFLLFGSFKMKDLISPFWSFFILTAFLAGGILNLLKAIQAKSSIGKRKGWGMIIISLLGYGLEIAFLVIKS